LLSSHRPPLPLLKILALSVADHPDHLFTIADGIVGEVRMLVITDDELCNRLVVDERQLLRRNFEGNDRLEVLSPGP